MNKLARYIFSQLLIGTMLVTAGLATVVWLAQSLRFVELIVNRGISASMFVYLVVLLLPNFIVLIIPFALLAAVLFTYNRLVQDRELAVMRSVGLSQGDLIRPAMGLAMLVTLVMYALYFHLVPLSKTAFKDLRWEIRHGYSQVVLQEGSFNTLSSNITVYVRERTSEGEVLGILARDSRNPRKPFTLMAERGALLREGTTTRIVMKNGNRQEVDRATGALSILYFDEYVFDLGLESGAASSRHRGEEEMGTFELLNIEQIPGTDPRYFNTYRVSGHSRIVTPLYALVFTLIGLSALLSGNFTRRSMSKRIVSAIVAVVLIKLASLGMEKLVIKNIALIPILYVSVAAFAAAPLYLIFKGPGLPKPTPTGAEA